MPGIYHCLSAFAVNAWLSAVASDDATVADSSRFQIMKENNKQHSIPQPDQLTAQQVDLAKFIPEEDTSINVDLMLDLRPAGGDRTISRGVKVGASEYSSVSDLTAEVDFEIGPDVSSEPPCNSSSHCWHCDLTLSPQATRWHHTILACAAQHNSCRHQTRVLYDD